MPMDLYEATGAVRRATEQYRCWREVQRLLREEAADAPVSAELAEACRHLGMDAASENRTALAEWSAEWEAKIRGELVESRAEAWYQEGKTLRYSLIVVQNRFDALVAALREGGAPVDGKTREILSRLEAQLEALRSDLGQWERKRVTEVMVCSVEQIEGMIADPDHAADKEHLERIVLRAHEAQLPESLACIRLEWDGVTGEVRSAEIIPTDEQQAA